MSDPREFHRNGLLAMSLIGGFALAALVYILGDRSGFQPTSPDYFENFFGYQMLHSTLTYDELLFAFGTLSADSVVLAYFMWVLTSRRDPSEFRTTDFVVRLMSGATFGLFGLFLGFVIGLFNASAGTTVFLVWTGLSGILLLASEIDERRIREEKKQATANHQEDCE